MWFYVFDKVVCEIRRIIRYTSQPKCVPRSVMSVFRIPERLFSQHRDHTPYCNSIYVLASGIAFTYCIMLVDHPILGLVQAGRWVEKKNTAGTGTKIVWGEWR
jgi:hypothetical protein